MTMTMRERLIAAMKAAASDAIQFNRLKGDALVGMDPWSCSIDAILAELRKPDEGMIAAGMAHAETDLASEFTAMIDHVAKGAA